MEIVWKLLSIPYPELQFEKMVENAQTVLWLVSNAHILAALKPEIGRISWMTDMLTLPRKPSIHSTFDVYFSGDKLIYVKEPPCRAEDVREFFFLHLIPVDVDDLPDHRKQYGFDNLHFHFNDYGFRSTEECVVLRELPDYAIAGIHTGQFLVNEDGSYTHLWEGKVRFDE